MENLIERWGPNNNFWESAPEFKVIEIFNKLFTTDKSKGKVNSSNIMWAISHCILKDSPMYNLPEKWEIAARDIVKDKNLNWETLYDVVEMFKQCSTSQAERSLMAWEELMAKRDKYLKGQEYYFDYIDENGKKVIGTAEQLDRAFSVTPRMFSDFAKIKKEIEEDEIKRGKGNKVKSLTEAGEI